MIFPPDLQALILCGGASKRMGREKFLLRYHEQLQWEHLLQMVQKLGGRVFVSCRQDQLPNFPGDCPVLVDDPSVLRPGPARAMLSAHRRFPDIAWFLIACDLPLLTEESVHSLCQARARDAWATAVFNEKTGFFEPLFAIWESRGLGAFAEQSTTCVACPSQFLKRNHTYVHLVSLPNYDELLNANTPACRKHVEEVIARRKASVAPSAQR